MRSATFVFLLAAVTWLIGCSGPAVIPTAAPAPSTAIEVEVAPPRTLPPTSVARASPSPETEIRVRLAMEGPGASHWALLVAERKELFQKHGVRVQITRAQPASGLVEQLGSGQADVVAMPAEIVLVAAEQGAEVVMVAGLVNRPVYSLMGAREVNGIADLRGRPVAAGDAKSARTMLLRRMLAAQGLPEGSYRIVSLGHREAQVDGVLNGTFAAALVEQPRAAALVGQHFRTLSVASDVVRDYQAEVLAARPQWARTGEGPSRFLRALLEGSAWLHEPVNKAEAAAILAEATRTSVGDATQAYELMVGRGQALARSGEPSPAGLRLVGELLTEAELLKRPIADPTRLIDSSSLERARSSR